MDGILIFTKTSAQTEIDAETLKELVAEKGQKNAPGKHDQSEHGSWAQGQGRVVTHYGRAKPRATPDAKPLPDAQRNTPGHYRVSGDQIIRNPNVDYHTLSCYQAWHNMKNEDDVKDYDGSFRSDSDPRGNPTLYEFQKAYGYDAKPQLLDDTEFAAFMAKEPLLYRGVAGPQYTSAFRTGELYAGQGNYGNGTYTIFNANDDGTPKTERYGARINAEAGEGASEYGANVMAMTLKSDAKVASWADIDTARDAEMNHVEERQFEIQALLDNRGANRQTGAARDALIKENDDLRAYKHTVLHDDGIYAICRGYDAIKVNPNFKSAYLPPYMVVLNRSAVRVLNRDLTQSEKEHGIGVK